LLRKRFTHQGKLSVDQTTGNREALYFRQETATSLYEVTMHV